MPVFNSPYWNDSLYMNNAQHFLHSGLACSEWRGRNILKWHKSHHTVEVSVHKTFQWIICRSRWAMTFHLMFCHALPHSYYLRDCTCFTECQASLRELERGSYPQSFLLKCWWLCCHQQPCFLCISPFVLTGFFLSICLVVFIKGVCFCVLRHVYNAPVQPPSFHMWCRFGKCFLTACRYDWCCLDWAVIYVYLTQQLRSSLVRLGQFFKLGAFNNKDSVRILRSTVVVLLASVFVKCQGKFCYGHLIRPLRVSWLSESQPVYQRPSYYWSWRQWTHIFCVCVCSESGIFS